MYLPVRNEKNQPV